MQYPTDHNEPSLAEGSDAMSVPQHRSRFEPLIVESQLIRTSHSIIR